MGRGSGKTFAGLNYIKNQINKSDDWKEIIIIGRTAKECRENNMLPLAQLLRDEGARYYSRENTIVMPSGATIYGFSAEVPDSIRGKNASLLWCDEAAYYFNLAEVWKQASLALRKGESKVLITTTPKSSNGLVFKEILEDKDTIVTTGSSIENFNNLSSRFQKYIKSIEGTRAYREEVLAELLEDSGILWKYSMFQRKEVNPEDCNRIVVAVDPATGHGEHSETGIVVCGKLRIDGEDHGVILADCSSDGTVQETSKEVIAAYHRFKADAIVVETNNGGDWIPFTLQQFESNLRIKEVRATRGKAVRAEPIVGLYEQGRVYHAQTFTKLEDQMVAFNPDDPGIRRERSPDRMDALVWGLTELFEDRLSTIGNMSILNQYGTPARFW